MTRDEAQRILRREGQLHLLKFWKELGEQERRALLADIVNIDWQVVREARQRSGDPGPGVPADHYTPPPVVLLPSDEDGSRERRRLAEVGDRVLREGRVAVLTVAGGLGTRLGFDGPKGMLPITPVRNKPLFRHLAENMLAAGQRYGREIPWLIMTSPDNHVQTARFFAQQENFGLPPSVVRFFRQGRLPVLSRDGDILLASKHCVAASPDGHGGTLKAVRASGELDRLKAQGIRYLSYHQVDNPLLQPLDAVFIGLVEERGSELGSKVVRKAGDQERAGVFVSDSGVLRVIEYLEFPPGLAGRRNADGSRTFDFANVAAHLFDVDFIERIGRGDGGRGLLPHRSLKKVTHIDAGSGRPVDPQEPNAIKLEYFIFDVIPLARDPVLLEVDRAEEFSPVKNPSGIDSAESGRADLSARAARWLRQCGVEPPAGPGRDAPRVEISPLFAMDVETLRERLSAGQPLHWRDPLYLGP